MNNMRTLRIALIVLALVIGSRAISLPSSDATRERLETFAATVDLRRSHRSPSDEHHDDIVSGVMTSAAAPSANAGDPLRRAKRLSEWLIVPNTRWCGRGNTANGTYNHLGGSYHADKCCRRHDHCSLFIPALSLRYNLYNHRLYTLSHCQCDSRFYACLKMADDKDADTIGKIFFNFMHTQCFHLKKETTSMCDERDEKGNCLGESTKIKAVLRKNKRF